MLADLSGKTALVTGGGQGIGRGIVTVLADQGANVVIADIQTSAADKLAEELAHLGRKLLVVQLDVTKQDSATAAAELAIKQMGQLDILVNNAGIASVPGADEETNWQATFAVNVMGAVHCCAAALPHMKEKRYGKIINIASMAGHAARRSGGAYGVTKAGVLRYTKGLAYEMASFNINVNAICPGALWTPFQQGGFERRKAENPALADVDPYKEFEERYAEIIPMGRPQDPIDIGRSVAFLASDDSSNITGQCLHVDGGAVLRD